MTRGRNGKGVYRGIGWSVVGVLCAVTAMGASANGAGLPELWFRGSDPGEYVVAR